jgi:hypothetical protein
VVEVQQRRSYVVEWRFISLKVLNEQQTADWYTPAYRRGHMAGLECLRVADAVRLAEGNDAVSRLYAALGTMIHNDQRGQQLRDDSVTFLVEALTSAGLDTGYASAALDEAHDAHIRAETALALERTGKDVGTPIITYHPGQADENSLFGPVIASIPRGDDAVKLWDAIELIATTSGMAELKRSLRSKPVFD